MSGARLTRFIEQGLNDYAARRDLPGVDGSSRLSAALHFGSFQLPVCIQSVARA